MNPGMRMYMMTNGAGPEMAREDGKYQERGIGNDEYGYPLPYREPRPEFGETEARYRGEDGRYKSGSRRSEMPSRKKRWEIAVTPQNTYREEPYMRPEPYEPGMYGEEQTEDYADPPGRVIGFASIRNHNGLQKQKPNQMHKGMHHMNEEPQMLDRETAMEWAHKLKNEDPQKPIGPKWETPFVKTMARNLGLPDDGPEFWEFYVMTNAMYSDYCKALQKFGVTDPMAYAYMAKAWMHDKDAIEDKTMVYYECIVKPKLDEMDEGV